MVRISAFCTIIGLFICSCFSKPEAPIYRFIDNIGSARMVSTGMEPFLKEIRAEADGERQAFQSGSLFLSTRTIGGAAYINMASAEKNWEGIHYLLGFEGSNAEYDFSFRFHSTGSPGHIQHFGMYLLSNAGSNAMLGLKFSRIDDGRMRLGYVIRELQDNSGSVSVARELEHFLFETNPDEIHTLHLRIDGRGIHVRIDDAINLDLPVPEKSSPWGLSFFPFVTEGDASFRFDNLMIDGSRIPDAFKNALGLVTRSNVRKFADRYKNEDFPLSTPFDGAVYKMPVGEDYRNALVGLTPSSFEYEIPEMGENAFLRLGYAVLEQSWIAGQAILFQVVLKDGPNELIAFEDAVHPDSILAHNRWKNAHIDLNKFPGGYSLIELRARSLDNGGQGYIAWSNPFIAAVEPKNAKPNILLISLDTVRWDRLSVMGYKRETTPNIDRIARAGALFTQCISQASWTTPSHFSIMTSQYPSIHGVIERMSDRYRRLSPGKLTLAEILRNEGYTTCAFVANSPVIAGKLGFFQGFDRYVHNGAAGDPHDIEGLASEALEWLKEEGKSRPFFLFLHSFETHLPFTNTFYAGDSVDYKIEAQHKKHRPDLYDGDLRFTDEHLAPIFEALDNLGMTDNTVLIITSDHGYVMYGEHGGYEGYSHNLYEGTVRVPLIMRYPAAITEPRTIRQQVRSIDIAPTILELAGIRQQPEFQGRSLIPLLNGEEMEPLPAFAEAMIEGPERKMIRTPLYKYIFIPEMIAAQVTELKESGFEVEKRELFNLENDPWENTNLAESAADVAGTYQSMIDKFILAGSAGGTGKQDILILNQEDIRRLRDLGYIK